MLSILGLGIQALSGIAGFAMPFVGDILGFFKKKQENGHELALMEMQGKLAKEEAGYRLEETVEKTGSADFAAAHKPQISFGVQILDKLADLKWSTWISAPLAYMFSFLDFLIGFVRPGVTYSLIGLYIATKWATFATTKDVTTIWSAEDMILLEMVLGFWCGYRTRMKIGTK